MWSSSNMDIKTLEVVMDHEKKGKNHGFEPTPYAFTKLENGKKTAADSTSMVPPSWLLLDHTIAVIWLMFDMTTMTLQQLSIDDLKWAHEFLRGVRNRRGENPPDVKVCLKEIQDRLINLYAQLTSLNKDKRTGSGRRQRSTFLVKTVGCNQFEAIAGNSPNKNSQNRVSEDFDEIAAAFGEKIMADSSTSRIKTCKLTQSITSQLCESKADGLSLKNTLSPSGTTLKEDLFHRHSSKDLTVSNATTKSGSAKHKNMAMNYSKKPIPIMEKDSNLFEESEGIDDEEVEKYILSLFEDEKNEEILGPRPSTRSFIPTKRKNPTTLSYSEMIATENSCNDSTLKKEKTSKKVHCVAEMRSLKFQKSMKVKDVSVSEGGEEAAYSNLKAEIRRLTINPDVSKNEIMKFLKEWRSEQVDRLHNELKRLNSIEEFMKSLNKEGFEPNLRKEMSTMKSNNSSLHKSLTP